MVVPDDIYPIMTIPVSELSWKSLNISSNSSNPDNDNTSVSKVSWWWCAAALRLLPQSLLSQITNNLLEPWPFPRPRSPSLASISTFLKFSFESNRNFFSKQTAILARSKTRMSRISLMFSFSNCYKSDFLIFACSQTRKVGCLKSEIFKRPSCRYLPIVKYEKLDFKNPRFTRIYTHSSFRYLPVAKYEHQNEVQDTSSRI